ncbi:MAG: TPR repeat protein [Gammaproteobacteria bacterium]|jgi:TPR repeat protein
MKKVLLVILLIILSACTESDDPKNLFDQGKYKEAAKLWLPLAKMGDPVAQNYIGITYYLGLGKDRDHKVAMQWFEKSAVSGYADAEYNLGVMYENGESVKKDYITAYKWFYLAKENGNFHAEKRMQGMAEEHKLFPNQMKRAVELAKKNSN